MSQPTQSFVRNCLLSALSADDFALIAPQLEAVDLPKDMVLVEENTPFDYAYFPNRGLGSVIASVPHLHQVEVGIFGREGMTSPTLLLGGETSPFKTMIQVAGDGYRMPADDLTDAITASGTLRMVMLRYVQTLMTQASFTALSNATLTIEERLARWLVMSHDRVDGDDVPLTHEFLSIMLGVRRPSVTSAIHMLEGNHLIRARRSLFTVLDREGLIKFAGGSYGQPEAEYHRLIGAFSEMRGDSMRFFFHHQTSDGLLLDPDGTELDDLDAAIREALLSARHLWADAIVRQSDLSDETFEINDSAGHRLASVSFVDALPLSLRNYVR